MRMRKQTFFLKNSGTCFCLNLTQKSNFSDKKWRFSTQFLNRKQKFLLCPPPPKKLFCTKQCLIYLNLISHSGGFCLGRLSHGCTMWVGREHSSWTEVPIAVQLSYCGQNPATFVYFHSFHKYSTNTINEKSIDVCLGLKPWAAKW